MDATVLRADCSACAALCCVVLPFAASRDFPFSKPADVPCRHLRADRCSIHSALTARGFHGCVAFDCFGAGQRATALAGRDATVFEPLQVLHELLWHLDDALGFAPSDALAAARLRAARLAAGSAESLRALDVRAERDAVAPLLRSASRTHRRRRATRCAAGADLAGANLRGADLADEDLRGAVLIGADLTGAVLTRTDVLGADLRGADLSGADVSGALFLTRQQIGSARIDGATALPPRLLTG